MFSSKHIGPLHRCLRLLTLSDSDSTLTGLWVTKGGPAPYVDIKGLFYGTENTTIQICSVAYLAGTSAVGA